MSLDQELYALFRRNFPTVVRAEETARRLLSPAEEDVILRRDGAGRLIGAAVLMGNAILMLCVDAEHRRQGIGASLLAQAEERLRARGCEKAVVGAGEDYLAPGVPTCHKPWPEDDMEGSALDVRLTDDACAFLRRRGYTHAWGECNCFDMRLDLCGWSLPPAERPELAEFDFRWALPEELAAVCRCVEDAHQPFAQYYADPALYREGAPQRVLIAAHDAEICGALIVSFAAEAPELGSVGCTAVAHAWRGRSIAARLVQLGTEQLRAAGLPRAFLGYTYSGLDKLYGLAGYRVCCFYFMAQKDLR